MRENDHPEFLFGRRYVDILDARTDHGKFHQTLPG